MRAAVFVMLAVLAISGVAHAQEHHHHHAAPPEQPQQNHLDQSHGAHEASATAPTSPASPQDHAADRYFDIPEMRAARRMLAYESGGMPASMIIVDRLEYQARKGADGYHWEVEGWFGGDVDRFAFKTQGEGEVRGGLDHAELQALWRHALDPWFNLEMGVRHDIRPQPLCTYAVVGVEGLAPYWFELGATFFLSNKGDAHLRLEGSYDQRLTQRLIAQPRAEINFAAQDVPEIGVGSGLSDAELGMRLRYEIIPEIAPYLGVSWERRFGDSRRYARLSGEGASSTAFVAGIRLWF